MPALDGLRGLAILLVMGYHYFQNYAPGNAVDGVVFGAIGAGWKGVDLFFVLSGFLITGILYDTKGTDGYLKNFWMRRVLRIFPLYYATLFAFFILLPMVPHALARDYTVNSAPDQFWFWTYLTNFRIVMREGWYDHLMPTVLWSLAIEEQFYMVWPLVVLVLRRRALMTLCVLLFVFAYTARVSFGSSYAGMLRNYVLPITRMDALVMGAFLALYARGPRGLEAHTSTARWVAVIMLAALIPLGIDRGTHWHDPLVHTAGFSCIAVLFGALLVMAVNAKPRSWTERLLVNRFLAVFGKYSYALYLFHGPAGSLVKAFYDPSTGPVIFGSHFPRVALYAALAAALSLAVSWLSWHVLEKHFIKLKRFFEHKRPAPVAQPEPQVPVGSA